MGDLSTLKREILDEAQAEAERIRQEARQKAEEILREARAEAESRHARILSEGEREAADQRRRVLTSAGLDCQRDMLAAKDHLIEEAVQLALSRISQLPLDIKSGLFVRLLLASAETGTEEIQPAKRDSGLIESLLPQVNLELARMGRKGQMRIGPAVEGIDSGFLVIGDGYRVDNSLGSLVLAVRDDVVPEVARILFR